MSIKEDWVMTQINILVRTVAQLYFKSDTIRYKMQSQDEQGMTESDRAYSRIAALLEAGSISDAETLLFDQLDPEDDRWLVLALDFYQQLNDMSDDDLRQGDFSRTEIDQGLHDVLQEFDICI